MGAWLSTHEFRNIKEVITESYWDSANMECREIRLIDSQGNIITIRVRLDGKK